MNAVELVLVAVSVALGLRSLVHWIRRPFEGVEARDHVLFALFVTARVGLWFSIAILFTLYALTDTRGRAFIDDVRRYDWFVLVFAALAATQFLAGYFLGRKRDGGDARPDRRSDEGRL